MKIVTFGAKHFTGQLPRIEEGFRSLGHEIITSKGGAADLIYANNSPYHEPLTEQLACCLDSYPSKTIFNVLDIPEHLFPDFDLNKLKEELHQADAVTCISRTVQTQLETWLAVKSTVIYNPIKDVKANEGPLNKTLPFLYVGRANDPNKRFDLAVETLKHMGFGPESLVVVGSENPGWGHYMGVVSDEVLNELYNFSKYVFLPSAFEGIGLPMIEALVCKSIPLLCNDNPTASELAPLEYICEPKASDIANRIRYLDKDYAKYVEENFKWYGENYLKQFSKEAVAQNILNVYASLKTV